MSLRKAQKAQIMSNVLIAIVLLSVASPVFAEQSDPAARSAARFGALRTTQSDPYRGLFEPQKSIQRSSAKPDGKPQVVCGMTIIPADPKNDPSMVLLPKSDGIDYKMRALDPPMCSPAR